MHLIWIEDRYIGMGVSQFVCVVASNLFPNINAIYIHTSSYIWAIHCQACVAMKYIGICIVNLKKKIINVTFSKYPTWTQKKFSQDSPQKNSNMWSYALMALFRVLKVLLRTLCIIWIRVGSCVNSPFSTVVCVKDGKASFLRFWKNHP